MELLQRKGGLLLILDDIEGFVQQGQTGLLYRLLMSPNATLQVRSALASAQQELQVGPSQVVLRR